MKSMSKVSLAAATSLAACFAASSAFALQNVANTSQKGSLLVWPLITVDTVAGSLTADTFVEISNDANASVHVECEYVNEQKGRVNFDFELTAKQTASWDVRTGSGDQLHPPPFPTNAGNPGFPGNPLRGELICFTTDDGRQFQVAWNELTGNATVMSLKDKTAHQKRQGFKYNAWAFAARDYGGLAADNNTTPFGTAGDLELTGANSYGVYDACPAYNIANFMPNGATLGNLSTFSNNLAVSGCNQDLRESYQLHPTKLDFTVWNSFENSFTGAYACADGVETEALSPSNPNMVQGSNFEYSTLGSPDARFQVRGISASPPCTFATEATGLLGVLQSENGISGSTASDAMTGNTLQGAGAEAGYVYWDPSSGVGGIRHGGSRHYKRS
jgi:hypothetical protein